MNQTLLPFSAKCASSKICPRIARAKSTIMILKIARHVGKRYLNAVQPACRPRALRAHSAQSGVKGHCPLREPRGIPPSGGISAASSLSLDASRAHGAQSGVQGISLPNRRRGIRYATAVKHGQASCPLLPCAPMARSPGCSASPYQIGEPWHPLCHGGKTTAKLHVPLLPCAPMARSPGCRGTAPAA